MKDTKRAERRFEKEKRKKKARKIYHWCEKGEAEKLADHLAECSCPMCCNPRRSKLCKGKDKLTIQERKQNLEEDE